MRVPLVDLKAQYQGLRAELLQRVESVLDGMQLFIGPETQAFEEEFAAYCGSRFAVAVDSGTAALYLSLRALDIGPGDEVVTVSNTFIATIGAIVQTGATPVFVDVDPATSLMDLTELEAAITSHTKAILPVHLYGRMVEMGRLTDIAGRHGLAVIEDACQAHGARWNGRAAGAWGDFGCFSFYFSKNLGAYGETGLVTTNDAAHAQRLRALRDHGSETKYHHTYFGGNWRPDEIQTAMLRVKLRHLDEWNAARRHHAERYRSLLAGVPELALPPKAGDEHVWHLFVAHTAERDALRAQLADAGIETGIHYPIPVHLQPAWVRLGGAAYTLPTTERLATEALSLPIYPELRPEQQDHVVDGVSSILAGNSRVAAP